MPCPGISRTFKQVRKKDAVTAVAMPTTITIITTTMWLLQASLQVNDLTQQW